MSGKWKINLIWCIHQGINRPGELHRTLPNASRRLLDDQLAQLVAHGMLVKKVFEVKPFKVEYALTPLGQTLIPVIENTARWGESYRSELEEKIQKNPSFKGERS